LLLDAPVEIGLDRISGREHDHFEREQRDFFERVRKTYLARAAAEPERFCVIDASRPRLEVEAAIARELIAFADRYKGTADNTT
jgi:dTMP kinase